MNLYVETSALLRVVLGEADEERIRHWLVGAERIVTSRLTLIEVRRVLWRLLALKEVPARELREATDLFNDMVAHFAIVPIGEEILHGAAVRFPVEPLRILDAIHLATIQSLGDALRPLVVLSTDARIRDNVSALGFRLLPEV